MDKKANELLMLLINDAYSQTGKIKKSTALKVMKFVALIPELQHHVNNCDEVSIKKFTIKSPT